MKKIKVVFLFIYFMLFGFIPCVYAASKNMELEIIVYPIVINIFCTALMMYQESIFHEELEKIKHKLGIKNEDIC